MKADTPSLRRKLRRVRLVIMDVDGVMTDGRIIYDALGTEYKCFNVHDGYGIKRAQDLGLKLAIITGRNSKVVDVRAKKLGIADYHKGVDDKVASYEKIRKRHRLKPEEICFIGDDEFDLPLLDTVGFSAAPNDALDKVKRSVDYVTRKDGGRGAVREVLDMVLAAQGLL